MKTILLIISFLVPISAFAFKNEPTSFRGIQWGDDIASHTSEMKFLRENKKGIKFYTKKNETLNIGDATLKQIMYGFGDSGFFIVHITVSGKANVKDLTHAFHTQFGEPTKMQYGTVSWGESSFFGNDSGTDTEVTIYCDYRSYTPQDGDCLASITSNKILLESINKKIKQEEVSVGRDF